MFRLLNKSILNYKIKESMKDIMNFFVFDTRRSVIDTLNKFRKTGYFFNISRKLLFYLGTQKFFYRSLGALSKGY